MAEWLPFAGLTAVVLAVLLVLSAGEALARSNGERARRAYDDERADAGDDEQAGPAIDDEQAGHAGDDEQAGHAGDDEEDRPGDDEGIRANDERGPVADRSRADDPLERPGGLSWRMLLVNALVVHGLVGVVLLAGAGMTGVPSASFGLAAPYLALGPVLVGLGIGIALYATNEFVVTRTKLVGVSPDERVREAIAPNSLVGWVALLGITLPIGAAAEELLFRGVLVGTMATGFGVPVWVLAVLSSVAFGVAHSTQGTDGVVVTTLLGGALAAVFVLTGSLVVVVVAHYVVNVLEFVLHEGLDVFDDGDPAGA